MASMTTPEPPDRTSEPVIAEADLQPALDMWSAALALFVQDGKAYVTRHSADPGCERETAYHDLIRCGPRTRWLARFCLLDPAEITRQFRRWLDEHRARGG